MRLMTNELEHLTWHEVESYLASDTRLAFVLGSTEQHGHLSLSTDTLTALHVAQLATAAEGVLLAPPLHFGNAGLLNAWPGTLSITVETYARVVVDLAISAYASGFRRLLFFNGHAGNSYVVNHLHEVIATKPDLICDFFEWAADPGVADLAMRIRPGGLTHANWAENWPISRVPGHPVPPEDVPWWRYSRSVFLYAPGEFRASAPSGSFGGPGQIDDAELQPLIDLAVSNARVRLRNLAGDVPKQQPESPGPLTER